MLGVLTGATTAFYIARWFVLTFLGRPRWPTDARPHETPASMTVPVILLAAASATAGLLNIPAETAFLRGWLSPAVATFAGDQPLVAHAAALWATVALAVAGLAYAWGRYGRGDPAPAELAGVTAWAARGFGVDDAYDRALARPGRQLARGLAVFDRRVIDGAIDGIATLVRQAAGSGRRLQTGLVRHYALGILAGAVLVLLLLMARQLP